MAQNFVPLEKLGDDRQFSKWVTSAWRHKNIPFEKMNRNNLKTSDVLVLRRHFWEFVFFIYLREDKEERIHILFSLHCVFLFVFLYVCFSFRWLFHEKNSLLSPQFFFFFFWKTLSATGSVKVCVTKRWVWDFEAFDDILVFLLSLVFHACVVSYFIITRFGENKLCHYRCVFLTEKNTHFFFF